MIKLVYCIRKKADIFVKEFHRYRQKDHGARVTSLLAQIEEGVAAFQALLEDESRFSYFSQSRVFMTCENLIFDVDLNIPFDGSPC
jgi:hypothetical protein